MNSKEALKKEANEWVVGAKKDCILWRSYFRKDIDVNDTRWKPIKDKIAQLSFVALLLAVTSAMFYTPDAKASDQYLWNEGYKD